MIRLIGTAGKYSAVLGLICLLLISAAILADALTRTAFNAPIYGLSDLLEVLTPVIVASCFPLTLAGMQNISIRFLGRALRNRAGQLVEFFGQLAALLVMAGIVWEVGRYTWKLVEHQQFTWLLHIPIWPSWILSTLLLALCLPIQTLVVVGVFENFKHDRPLASSEAGFQDTGEDNRR